MRQGYLGFCCEDSPADYFGGPCFEASILPLPLPFFLPFKGLSAVVDRIAWTSEVLLGPGGFWEELLGTTFETNFCLEEYLVGFGILNQ